ncbi:phosphoadenylyl-sulfate reductase [Azonexus sp.]|uniref:phosphoadenylyl-sulfate reductase n=1 Tax=Azonexus sp. TaxID=1872668 RepID=UPI0039E2155E
MNPKLLTVTPELSERTAVKTAAALALLRHVAQNYSPAVFANSLGAEDMVLTDLICKNQLPIEIFSLDTGRLPSETYDLMAELDRHYGLKLKIYYPQAEPLERYVRQHGINAFYDSVDLRKACCHLRKVEPLQRALSGQRAWITGMRAEQAATRGQLAQQTYDESNALEKFNPLADWSEQEVWAYLKTHAVPYNPLHEAFYPSIGCAPCTRAISPGEDIRAGRWWWENPQTKECGLHIKRGGT